MHHEGCHEMGGIEVGKIYMNIYFIFTVFTSGLKFVLYTERDIMLAEF